MSLIEAAYLAEIKCRSPARFSSPNRTASVIVAARSENVSVVDARFAKRLLPEDFESTILGARPLRWPIARNGEPRILRREIASSLKEDAEPLAPP